MHFIHKVSISSITAFPGVVELRQRFSEKETSINLIEDLCISLGQQTNLNQCLLLLVESYGLFGGWTRSSSKTTSSSPKTTLHQLIGQGVFKQWDPSSYLQGTLIRRFSKQQKRSLAVQLGYCLLDFFDADLSPNNLYLVGTSNSPAPRDSVYLSFLSGLPQSDKSRLFKIGHPLLISFAKLLLEIEYGQSIELGVDTKYSNTNKTTWIELSEMVDRLCEDQNSSYLKAVRGSLHVHEKITKGLRQLEKTGSAAENDIDFAIRKLLYKQVVRNLDHSLAESMEQTESVKRKRPRSESPEPAHLHHRRKRSRNVQDEKDQQAFSMPTTFPGTGSTFQLTFRPRSSPKRTPSETQFQRRNLSVSALPPLTRESSPFQFKGSNGLFDDTTPPRFPSDM